ncbi:hypothetical protein G6M26_50945 [Agrobacterium tumefaciens]|nr:hypothetical protein [Agrobacterium tumefaciens]NTE26867.1 hypothetical protein [Agrobacterium tumefaciens]
MDNISHKNLTICKLTQTYCPENESFQHSWNHSALAVLLLKLKMYNMKDPKEQEEKATAENANPEVKPHEDSNWNEHQQVDEEGNELDPDDIK